MSSLTFYCDDARHLVCKPYSIENLHEMADILGIKRCWYHSCNHPHYDIPVRVRVEVEKKCIKVSSREIIKICNG